MHVSIDPGNVSGWALWERGALVACGLGDPRESEKHRIHEVDHVWIEWPVIYPRSRANPNDIKKLAGEAGRWAGIYSVFVVETHFVEPAEWKGQTPKEKHHPRIWARLTSTEQGIVDKACRGVAPSKRHNVLDAVGIGLWVAKRMDRRAPLRVVK